MASRINPILLVKALRSRLLEAILEACVPVLLANPRALPALPQELSSAREALQVTGVPAVRARRSGLAELLLKAVAQLELALFRTH
jgi:hypothetical protein